MSDAHERFFNIQELVHHVTLFLSDQDVGRLALTNWRLNEQCTPKIYRTIDVVSHRPETHLFQSIPGLQALARNIRHLRSISIRVSELAYYYNCVLTLEEMTSLNANDDNDDKVISRPAWLPPPDIRTCQFIAMPLMTRLTRLTVYPAIPTSPTYSLPSVDDSQATLAQLCWLIYSNPGLTHLNLHSVPIWSGFGERLFGDVIAGLSRLKQLEIWIICKSGHRLQLGSRVIFSCQPSIQVIVMHFLESEPGDNDLRDSVEKSRNMAAIARAHEPLINLEELIVKGSLDWASTSSVRSIFAHCPNIRKLNVPFIPHLRSSTSMGEFVGSKCRKIKDLTYDVHELGEFDDLPFTVLNTLPAQQLIHFTYKGFFNNTVLTGATIALQRHSTTLRSIRLINDSSLRRISLAIIFRECINLDLLSIPCYDGIGHYIDLTDAVKHPWGCTRLTLLHLGISECELPYNPLYPPYYYRSYPISLSDEEAQHFSRLECLYSQIGKLTQMKHLTLNMVKLDQDGLVARIDAMSWFPAMLSLGCFFSGQPGYLHLLSGLEQLETFSGSIRADTEEAQCTIYCPEMVWMNDHWPHLRLGTFFASEEDVSAPFRWLLNIRDEDQDPLMLGVYL
ncbi:hypothetical protein BG015_009314 [Linnemannia schmuckeri]|uniref:Uncharacterized protein n=1 Tax=Linnemannia schmuckeri TaxID=64567 RepID=A0A9P5RXU4_9FUNG|nr:hypothetical protein BG015_009314 [Linnemannia schmuckeri]